MADTRSVEAYARMVGDARWAVGECPPGSPLEVRAVAAMDATAWHWHCDDDDERFRAAVDALRVTAAPDEVAAIDAELAALEVVSSSPAGLMRAWSKVSDPSWEGVPDAW